MRHKALFSWVAFFVALAMVVYGFTNRVEIIKSAPDASGVWVPVDPPALTEISEFEAIKLFGGTGITNRPDSYPQQNEYTGVCFA